MSMTVQALREAIAGLPDHWEVCVAIKYRDFDGAVDTELWRVCEIERQNLPNDGNMLALVIDESGPV